VVEPPRPLLEEYRRWMADDLGYEYIALLSDARLANDEGRARWPGRARPVCPPVRLCFGGHGRGWTSAGPLSG
jgi:hypothetical protein